MARPLRGQAKARFAYHRTVRKLSSDYVYGQVTNTGNVPIANPRITVVLYDEAGKEITSKSGFSHYDSLAPGQTAPVTVLLYRTPPYARLGFEVTARPKDGFLRGAKGLRVVQHQPRPADYGTGWRLSGKIENSGRDDARFVKVLGLGYDANDKLACTAFSYASKTQLSPGDSARYEFQLLCPRDVARYEIVALGRRAR